ncbi:MAG TPA: heparin lyase I family protein [Microvirga sp.]|jgi:hypothetical protein|nr:heparin lyase I family protein [Microvirga sp.]
MPGAHRCGRLPAAAFGALLAASPAQAQAIRDDFAGPRLSSETWFVCHRDENGFTIVPVPERGFNAARAEIRDRPSPARPGASGAHAACADERGHYRRDAAQRAELWEEDALHLPVGTEVWYGFAMYIDPAVPPRHGHLVIGQWKQRGGNSPFVAQRFRGRSFTITIEQDDRSPGRRPDRTQCRILVASDRDEPGPRAAAGAGTLPSAAHGEADPVPVLAPPSSLQRLPGCATDLRVERFGPLPNPFGRWTTMRYRIKATAADDGLLEVWADGQPIVKVTGRFGYAADRDGADQYFKFGPYREPAEGSLYAMIARFRRGPGLEDVSGD